MMDNNESEIGCTFTSTAKNFWNPLFLFLFLVIFVICVISVRTEYRTIRDSKMAMIEVIENNQKNEKSITKYLSFRLSAYSRLGNHIFELSSLLGISRLLNRTPVFYVENKLAEKMFKDTNYTMPGLIEQILVINGTVPPTARNTSFHPRCCIFEDPKVLLSIDDQHLHLHGFYYQSHKYFPGIRNELIGYLRKPEQKSTILPKSDKNTFVTCAHIRRGDFMNLGFSFSDKNFIKSALEFIDKREKAKKRRKVTIIFGDDVNFMKSLFNDTILSNENVKPESIKSTHFVSRNSPTDDLIYSKNNCDVVLISASPSTFGWWIGYFSKGNKVYYMDIRVTKHKSYVKGDFNPVDFYLPHWTPLKFAADNTTIIVSPF